MHVVCDCYIQAAQFNKLLFLYLIFYKTYIFIFREKRICDRPVEAKDITQSS